MGKYGEGNARIIIPAAIGLWPVALLVFNNKIPGWLQAHLLIGAIPHLPIVST